MQAGGLHLGGTRARDRNQTRVEFLAVHDDNLFTVVARLTQSAPRGQVAASADARQVDDAGIRRRTLRGIHVEGAGVETVSAAALERVHHRIRRIIGCGQGADIRGGDTNMDARTMDLSLVERSGRGSRTAASRADSSSRVLSEAGAWPVEDTKAAAPHAGAACFWVLSSISSD